MPVEAVQEGLREGADHDRNRESMPPVAVVPPLEVAGLEPVLRGAAVALDAVDEVEPVALRREAPVEPVDRLDEASAVAGLHLRNPIEGLQRRDAGRDPPGVQHSRAPVTRDPQARAAVLALPAAPRQEQDGEGQREPAELHGSRFERTAPGAVAQTRPRCGFRHARPFGAAIERPATWIVAPPGTLFRPWSSCALTE